VTSKEWEISFDSDGRLINVEHMKERLFRSGLESNTLRREGWKFLLNYYPWSSTRNQRIDLTKQRELEYFSMKLQWKSMNEQQKQRNTLFRDRESLIGKVDYSHLVHVELTLTSNGAVHFRSIRNVI
jgi:TBC1 domain family member 15